MKQSLQKEAKVIIIRKLITKHDTNKKKKKKIYRLVEKESWNAFFFIYRKNCLKYAKIEEIQTTNT